MADVLTGFSTRKTPQSQKADPRQVKNSAGGHAFVVGDEARLLRFLTLGTEGGTYYVKAPELTRDNAQVVLRMAEKQPDVLLKTILDVSLGGRAPKQNPTLFALAIAVSVGDVETRAKALAALPQVVRTGTMLYQFVTYVKQFRGWGPALVKAVAGWYTGKTADEAALQAIKYRQREGWTHRDVLRLSHPKSTDPAMRALFDWITHNNVTDEAPRLIEGFLSAQSATDPKVWASLTREHRLTWEMLPDAALGHASVWDALLDVGIPQTALMRQLPRLTKLGMLPNTGGRTAEVVERLTDVERLKRGRIHPINVLVAQRTYASGRSARGESTWTPSRKVVDALDAAFYLAFGAVEPAGKRTLLALDISGSMTAPIANMPLTCREASAAMALVTLATEKDVEVVGFTGGGWYGWSNRQARDPLKDLTVLSISPRQRLDDAIRSISDLPMGGTDCALPFLYAMASKQDFDHISVYTDSETWVGAIHPHQALEQYEQYVGHEVRASVIGMTSTGFSVLPEGPRALQVAGLDSAVPQMLADFAGGRI